MMIREKIEQAADVLKELQIDAWLTFERESKTNGDPMHGFIAPSDVTWQSAFLISAAGDAIAIIGNLDAAELQSRQVYDSVISYVESIRDPLRQALSQLDPATIAINYSADSAVADGLTLGLYRELCQHLEGTPFGERLVSAEPLINALRGRKSPQEIALMREAARLTLELFDAVSGELRPGISEREVAAFVQSRMDTAGLEGAWSRAFCPAVFTGPDTAGAHAAPTDRVIAPGHLVNMDFGVKYRGYCADLQRTWYVPHPGEGIPAPVQNGFRVLREAIDRVATQLRPGAIGHEMDKIARDHLEDSGFVGYPHGLGHQLGREAHDGGALLGPDWARYGNTPFLPVEAGQVFTIEPRLQVIGHGTVTIEEEVWIREDGITWLAPPQQTLWIAGS